MCAKLVTMETIVKAVGLYDGNNKLRLVYSFTKILNRGSQSGLTVSRRKGKHLFLRRKIGKF